ncbi:Variant-specific surface protein, partial [Giardia duodenalis]
KCTACAENCLTCNDANAGQCTKCSPGFFLSGGSPGTCSVCGANCATCTQAGDDKCLTCKQGYFMKTSNGPGQCFACDDTKNQGVAGCAQCSGGATPTCTKCKPNYKENSVGTFSCTKVCEDETACGGTAGSCDAIVIGASGEMTYYCSLCADNSQYPIDGLCVDNSKKGNNQCSNGVCTSCTTGYFLYMGGCYNTQITPGSLMCSKASTTPGVCETPNANSRYFAVPGAAKTDQSVLGCGNPLGTNTTSTNVYVGVEDCRTCTAPSEASNGAMAAAKCTACDEGKALTGSGYGCVTCGVAGCSACRADNMCEACSDGHRLEGGTCVRTGGNLSTGAMAGISVTKSSYALCC